MAKTFGEAFGALIKEKRGQEGLLSESWLSRPSMTKVRFEGSLN